ncbi:diguanylate cyclase domain-containing protein [Roseibium sp. SCP14]|uniref:diguanylate cyclase domain-containing protein n=1 Tax=Roseibium sp. SCP14 TaxID=3141375 RepID=UPI003336E799
MSLPVPENEKRRLQFLRDLRILDTEREPGFDALADLARTICGTPFAAITFMEEHEQWLKSSSGAELGTVHRQDAFCAQTIVDQQTLVIEDALADPRFSRSALVVNAPKIRFYAGCPLVLDGDLALGSLCVLDVVARCLTEDQIKQLERLAEAVVALVQNYRTVHLAAEAAVEARELQRAAETRQKLLEQMEDIAQIGAWKSNLHTQKLEWSDQIYRMYGAPIDEEPCLSVLLDSYPEEERAKLVEYMDLLVETQIRQSLDVFLTRQDGVVRRLRIMGEAQKAADGTQELLGIAQDITEQYEIESELWTAAHFDSLSGLANRKYFNAELKEQTGKALGTGSGLALLLIDVDYFKYINDTFGHLAGDEVVRAAGVRIAEHFNSEAFCARLGGDEFAVLTPYNGDRIALVSVAEDFQAKFSLPIQACGNSIPVDCSIGIAVLPENANTPEDLLKFADFALYSVKRRGRGGVEIYQPAHRELFLSAIPAQNPSPGHSG